LTKKICLISFPSASYLTINVLLYNLIDILYPLCKKLYLITSNIPPNIKNINKLTILDVKRSLHLKGTISPIILSDIIQLYKIIYIQIKMCIYLRYISKDVDIVFFYVGGSDLLLPILYAKILKKEVITSAIGRNSLGIKYSTVRGNNLNKLKYVIFTILEELTFLFSDKIMVESFNAISFLKLNKYSDKIFYKGARFIDINEFYIKNDILDRQNIIGYIGRLNEEKGILNLLKSILILSEMYTDISFKIVGNGPLYPYVINFLKEKKLFNKRVIVYGWVPNEKIPDYLNEIKFLILPSYSEGLPTIILEAMACGTIVISSPVGAIPDIIKDGKSGFLMDDNKPDTIVNTFIKVKDNLNLRNISQYSHILIESEYSYKAAILRYKKLLNI